MGGSEVGQTGSVAGEVVVGAAIVDGGRVLAARRSAPPEVAGGWEFPGGKVDPGESDEDALVRECREELGVEIGVRNALGAEPLRPGVELRVYRAELLFGDPTALQDHDDVRWLYPHELDDVAWLPGDLPFLPAVAAALRDDDEAT
jgi:8-oxo-dGTP diphosphatase